MNVAKVGILHPPLRESRVSDQSVAPLQLSNTTVRILKHDRYTVQYLYPLFKKLINELKILVLVSLALMEEIMKISLMMWEVICLLILKNVERLLLQTLFNKLKWTIRQVAIISGLKF